MSLARRAPRLAPAAFCAVAVTFLAGCSDDSLERTGEVELAETVCAAGETVEGIDVSVWQGAIDWPAVKGSGIGFAIARAGYGANEDDYFAANWAGMKDAGLVRGAYQYFLADQDPIAQADFMIAAIGDLGPGDLPPVIDIESSQGQSAATIIDSVGQWLTHVESAIGRRPMIYTGKYFWQDSVASGAFVDYPLWIPNYSYDCPNLPDGYWSDWSMFQYTDSGSIPGIGGNVDRDHFNGSMADLLAFANGGFAGEFVSQSFPYASEGAQPIVAGETLEVFIEMRNVGSRPWDSQTRLATTEPRDRQSVFAGPEWPSPSRYAAVEGVVNPGETYKFTFTLHAPAEVGVYDEFFGMVQDGEAWFSDPGHGGPPDNQLEGLFEVVPNPGTGNGSGGGSGGVTAGVGGNELVSDERDPGADGGCSISAAPSSRAPWDLLAFVSLAGLFASRRRRSRSLLAAHLER